MSNTLTRLYPAKYRQVAKTRRFIASLNAHRGSRRARSAPCGRRRFGLEQLERRYLLTAVSWNGHGDGTSWTDRLNWSTGAVPAPGDDVTISISGNPTIQLSSGTQAINSLVTSNLVKITGGTLQVAATAQIGANLTLAGGTILGGHVQRDRGRGYLAH
jgi:hypothetical protein